MTEKIYARIESSRARIQHLRFIAENISDRGARRALERVIASREDHLHMMMVEHLAVRLYLAEQKRDGFNQPGGWVAELARVEGEYKKIVEARR
jgi:hypothetical protein